MSNDLDLVSSLSNEERLAQRLAALITGQGEDREPTLVDLVGTFDLKVIAKSLIGLLEANVVTPEMIEAGRRVYWRWHEDGAFGLGDEDELIADVYLAVSQRARNAG